MVRSTSRNRLPSVVLARVEPERLFVQVAEQVEGLDGDVRALDRALEQRPEVFQPVGVDVAARVGLGVVDDLVGVVGRQSIVGLEGIGVERRAGLDVLLDLGRAASSSGCSERASRALGSGRPARGAQAAP